MIEIIWQPVKSISFPASVQRHTRHDILYVLSLLSLNIFVDRVIFYSIKLIMSYYFYIFRFKVMLRKFLCNLILNLC
jgi:hypothetical protein